MKGEIARVFIDEGKIIFRSFVAKILTVMSLITHKCLNLLIFFACFIGFTIWCFIIFVRVTEIETEVEKCNKIMGFIINCYNQSMVEICYRITGFKEPYACLTKI